MSISKVVGFLLGIQEASQMKLEEAAKLANCHDLKVDRLMVGLDLWISDLFKNWFTLDFVKNQFNIFGCFLVSPF